ncbi:glycoside hydrolase family 26 protein [uncultured Hymenobacter sp.]|uniref:glycoside hydrolase family 26 protein n=1 Tax=uncultured Hymenobacter sp. TaxID=170016 RepID=UPI0035CB0639
MSKPRTGYQLQVSLLLAALLVLAGCVAGRTGAAGTSVRAEQRFPYPLKVVDKRATYQTKAVFYNLRNSMGKRILFGQQDATQYGIGWRDEPDRSDVKSVSGSHPALYGWDVAELVNARRRGRPANDSVLVRHRQLVIDAYERGGFNTFCWHMDNFVTGRNFYDTTGVVVKAILPGGAQHAAYVSALDVITDYFNNLRAADGTLVPVIFRPFHEHTGSWFWWGKRHCTREEFVQLWQFTVRYLRDKKQVHNLLFAYSPDRVPDMAEYFERYPGDEYVDVLGFDDYSDFDKITTPNKGVATLAAIVGEAGRRGKIAALTEAGLEKITAPAWFNDNLLGQIKADPQARQIAYLMVWRNAHLGHFYAPYPGHASVPGFLEFQADSLTVFEQDHPRLYTVP